MRRNRREQREKKHSSNQLVQEVRERENGEGELLINVAGINYS